MKLILLYGPPAVGKFTIAKELVKLTAYKLLHNHMTVDLLNPIFTFGSSSFTKLNQKIRIDIFEQAAKDNINGLIFTNVYDADSPADKEFIKNVITVVEDNGGEVCFVQVICDSDELKKRVTNTSRNAHGKLSSIESLDNWMQKVNVVDKVPYKESLVIDNTSLSAIEVAKTIAIHYKLQ